MSHPFWVYSWQLGLVLIILLLVSNTDFDFARPLFPPSAKIVSFYELFFSNINTVPPPSIIRHLCPQWLMILMYTYSVCYTIVYALSRVMCHVLKRRKSMYPLLDIAQYQHYQLFVHGLFRIKWANESRYWHVKIFACGGCRQMILLYAHSVICFHVFHKISHQREKWWVCVVLEVIYVPSQRIHFAMRFLLCGAFCLGKQKSTLK